MSARHSPGRHELGQNFLSDPAVIRDVVQLAARGHGPLLEWAAGDGALTKPLSMLGRPLEAVEIDSRRAAQLRRAVGPHVAITEGDILRHAPPDGHYDVVCNMPFHITTPVMRRLLGLPGWGTATLILQWEVARKRAGVGGATQLTAQWWPWFEFSLQRRIAAASFTPHPSVDAGLLFVERRSSALVTDRADYQRWIRRVFTGPGRGLPQVLAQAGGIPAHRAEAWCRQQGLTSRNLPKDLRADHWVSAFRLRRDTAERPLK